MVSMAHSLGQKIIDILCEGSWVGGMVFWGAVKDEKGSSLRWNTSNALR